MSTVIDEKLISVTEAAAIIGCTTAHVRLLLSEGKLVGQKIHARSWIVDRDSAKAYSRIEQTVGRPKTRILEVTKKRR